MRPTIEMGEAAVRVYATRLFGPAAPRYLAGRTSVAILGYSFGQNGFARARSVG